ncbi:MAG TPA: 6-carboxytetrahydropterin synthase QueD [Syntrophorhabdaceae bacterium]|nr:6-carboxytetrahydropterin synthase QueD [Syntrophorhabdaceae bacterium]
MFTLYITDTFSAAHRIEEYHGKCEELHGHNFKVEVLFEGDKLGPGGMLIDFKVLKNLLKDILSSLDHKYLNEIEFFKKRACSSEYIAVYIYNGLKKLIDNLNIRLHEVRVWESESAYASYRE